jgi:hypothetical protein
MGQLSQHLLRKLLQQLTDGSPFERSIGNLARMVIAVAEYPCFADGTIAGSGAVSRSAKRRPPQSRY